MKARMSDGPFVGGFRRLSASLARLLKSALRSPRSALRSPRSDRRHLKMVGQEWRGFGEILSVIGLEWFGEIGGDHFSEC